MSRRAVGFRFGDFIVGRAMGRVSGEVVWGKRDEVGESMSSGESIISAVYSNTSLCSLAWEVDPLEHRGISSNVKPLEGAVMNVS